MKTEDRSEQILLYSKAYELLTEALMKFPKEMWTYKPGPQQWSIHEIVVHITDSEANSYCRCRCLIAEPGKTIMAYDQDSWAIKLNYHQLSTDEALELFRLLRLASWKIIRDLPEETWHHTIMHPENGIMTMEDWLKEYAAHIPVHISQMNRVYQSWISTHTVNQSHGNKNSP